MAENNNQVQERNNQSRSFIGVVFATLVSSLFLSILVEWLGIAFFWQDLGAEHSKQVMMEEFAYLSSDFQQSLILSNPVQLTTLALAKVEYYLMIKTGLAEFLKRPQNEIAHYIVFYAKAYVMSVLYVTMTFVIRLMIIFLSLPLFVLTFCVGLVDGLVQRDLRRFGVGRESAFKYHHAKRLIAPSLMLSWLFYLSVPFSIHPNIILIPASLLLGMVVLTTTSNFKKYL